MPESASDSESSPLEAASVRLEYAAASSGGSACPPQPERPASMRLTAARTGSSFSGLSLIFAFPVTAPAGRIRNLSVSLYCTRIGEKSPSCVIIFSLRVSSSIPVRLPRSSLCSSLGFILLKQHSKITKTAYFNETSGFTWYARCDSNAWSFGVGAVLCEVFASQRLLKGAVHQHFVWFLYVFCPCWDCRYSVAVAS